MKTVVLYSLYCVLFLCGCKTAKINSQENKLTFTKLISNSYGGYLKQKFSIINNKDGLTKIYNQVNMFRKPGFKKPKINFANNSVISMFLGQKKYGGYSIIIDKIVETKFNIIVYYKITVPKPEESKIMAINSPFYFCKIKSTQKKVIFKPVE